VAERVLEEMLTEANVTVLRGLVGIASAVVVKGKLVSVNMVTGQTITASAWVDGSYEGDLAFAAGATMVWGRESNTTYVGPPPF
jgi:hypothetical protein